MKPAPWALRTARQFAALYLAREFGVRRATDILASTPRGELVSLPPLFAGETRYKAEMWQRRVELMIAYQEGRLGRPLHMTTTILELVTAPKRRRYYLTLRTVTI